MDLTDNEFNLLLKNRENNVIDALTPVDKDCNVKYPFRTRIKDHAKVNFKYCYKNLECAKGKKKMKLCNIYYTNGFANSNARATTNP